MHRTTSGVIDIALLISRTVRHARHRELDGVTLFHVN